MKSLIALIVLMSGSALADAPPRDERREQLIELWKSAVMMGDKETMQFALQRLFPPAPQRTKCTPDKGGGYTCITE